MRTFFILKQICTRYYKEKKAVDKKLKLTEENVQGCDRLRLERDGEPELLLEARRRKKVMVVRSHDLKTWEKEDFTVLRERVQGDAEPKVQ